MRMNVCGLYFLQHKCISVVVVVNMVRWSWQTLQKNQRWHLSLLKIVQCLRYPTRHPEPSQQLQPRCNFTPSWPRLTLDVSSLDSWQLQTKHKKNKKNPQQTHRRFHRITSVCPNSPLSSQRRTDPGSRMYFSILAIVWKGGQGGIGNYGNMGVDTQSKTELLLYYIISVLLEWLKEKLGRGQEHRKGERERGERKRKGESGAMYYEREVREETEECAAESREEGNCK